MDFVFAIRELVKIALSQAESPVSLVVARTVRYCIRSVRQRVKMGTKLGQRHRLVGRYAVPDEMEIVLAKVDNSSTIGVFHKCVAHVPFVRNGPIENLCSTWDVVSTDRNLLFDEAQRIAHAVPRDACDRSGRARASTRAYRPRLVGRARHAVYQPTYWA